MTLAEYKKMNERLIRAKTWSYALVCGGSDILFIYHCSSMATSTDFVWSEAGSCGEAAPFIGGCGIRRQKVRNVSAEAPPCHDLWLWTSSMACKSYRTPISAQESVTRALDMQMLRDVITPATSLHPMASSRLLALCFFTASTLMADR